MNNSTPGDRGRGRGQGRGRGRGRGRGLGQGGAEFDAIAKERAELRVISHETKALLPGILASAPNRHLKDGFLYRHPIPPRLDQKYCPKHKGTRIQVLDSDTFDAGIQLSNNDKNDENSGTVAVLNMASDMAAGGGWLGGARAQEEALCRRSTLISTLDRSYYPTPPDAVIYSPSVMIFRHSLKDGHGLMDLSKSDTLPIVSVISMAALRRPEVMKGADALMKYANANDRNRSKEKMRTILRLAAWKRHRKIVLGALGCGAFRNPPEEVAECWAEVFAEPEFGGGWWESVAFAVIDETGLGIAGNGNVGIFYRRLHGIEV
ncbi:hypothetical protein FQN50_004026 [Emmonsiellopsis sp. PD_5]|nr:hypothetical protein FQN50_004026 [Emmonsiellopsis sp. PD_5]